VIREQWKEGSNMRQLKIFVIVSLAVAACGIYGYAQPQQSAHFRITKAVMDGGGAPSSSAHFLC